MEEGAETRQPGTFHTARFEFAPPRNFLLPAVLLLLSEAPSYGYNLVKDLRELRFGEVDRPAVYRALSQLERDGLVASSDDTGTSHQRRVYRLTDEGARALRRWMGVIREEWDGLGRVLRRYMATRSEDAVLAEVESGWGAGTTPAWSRVSSTSELEGRRARRQEASDEIGASTGTLARTGGGTVERFHVVAERSAVLIEVRSSVGPIEFGAVGLTGHLDAVVEGNEVIPSEMTAAHLEIAVDQLRSGNKLYDAELLRRVDARRYPSVHLDLGACERLGCTSRYRISGEMTFHGTSRPMEGTVDAQVASGPLLRVTGDQQLDIRDFGITSPTVLMLRIYPDIAVRLQVEAAPVRAG